ncbi:MAG TPA: ABC-2 family transporter protein [Limnochordia bacterium]
MSWRRYLALLGVFVKISFQDDAAYRAEFVAELLSTLYSLGIVAAGLWVFFSNTDQIAGWSLNEVIVLIGSYHIIAGVVRAVFSPNFARVIEEVREGTLDFVLTKPVNSQFLTSFRRITFARINESLLGLVVVGYGFVRLGAAADPWTALAFVAAIGCGLVVLYSFWIFIVTLVFWFVRIENVTEIFWALFEAGRYPRDIYPGWLRLLLSYIVPVTIVTTVPARGLAGSLSWPALLGFAAGAACALILASRFWRYGVSHYTSASS